MVDFLNYISSPMTHSCAISYANASISLWADMRCNGRLVMPCWFLPRPQIFTPHPPSSPPSSLCHQPRVFLPLKLCLCVCVSALVCLCACQLSRVTSVLGFCSCLQSLVTCYHGNWAISLSVYPQLLWILTGLCITAQSQMAFWM